MRLALKAYTLSGCMELMAQYADGYERLGGENVIFCEDRLTLIAERALVKQVGGTFRSTVTTFARFLKAAGKTVSKQGSVMLVGEVMTNLQREGRLQCFTSTAGIAKNARAIYETLAQFAASQITPALLREGAAQVGDTLQKKIADLALIYEGYSSALLAQGYLDESRYLTLLPQRIREEGCLKGKNVFFLGYTSFTGQAKETIRAALETANNVVGIFCAGEEDLYTNHAFNAFVSVCEEEKGKVETPKGGYPLEGDAELLRRGLFNPERPSTPTATENVTIFEAEDKTLETEFVATKIKRAMAENPALRYRDFAVLTSSVQSYALPLKKAFGEYGIPYFLDEKKSMRAHPLSRFLLDALRVVKEGYSPASVQALTQNYFFGESDEYRNYLYKFANYRGGAKRPIKKGAEVEKLFHLDKLEDARERVLLATENIKARGHGRVYCRAIREILQKFEVEKGLEKLDFALEDVAQKGYLAQIYRALDSVLSEAELLVGGKELTIAEFSAILEDGFDAMEISLIPLKADAVFVGDITESRIEKVSRLFALGMTDEVPRSAGDTAIVSDKEIERLSVVKPRLEPTVAEVNLRTRECVGLNLCTFTDKLYLSYPLSADGSEPALSEIFRYIDVIFCENTGGKLLRKKKMEPADFPYRCSATAPAVRQALYERAEYEEGESRSFEELSAVVVALKRMGILDAEAYWQLHERQDYISGGQALFFDEEGLISPTSLEGYFACPFGHFAERALRLKEREEATVLATDSGSFIHALLEKTAVRAKEFATEADMRKYAYEVGEDLMRSSVYVLQQDTVSGEYSSKRMLAEGVDVVVAAYRQLKNSAFEVEQTEAKIKSDLITGKVDRIDGTPKYVRIIDYKTGNIDDTATAYYTGQKIQMQLYMHELGDPRIPAGIFYFPASVAYSDEDEGRFRMKGFLNADEEALLAGDKDLGKEDVKKKSEYFGAPLKRDNRLKKVMDEEVLRDFLAYGRLVAEQGAEEIREGYIAPSPYEKGCEYCKYGGMCGFTRERSHERKEVKITPAEIAGIAAEHKRKEGETTDGEGVDGTFSAVDDGRKESGADVETEGMETLSTGVEKKSMGEEE